MHLPDTALLERMQLLDDKAAFDELYHRYWEKLYIAAYARLQNDADAKDCLQEVFVSLWHKRKEIVIRQQLDAYLFISLKYRVLNHLRNNNNYQKHLDIFGAIPAGLLPSADDHLFLSEIQGIIAATIADMPEKMREIYLLSRRDGLSVQETADKLGISAQTVKNQLSNALKRLKDRLSGYK
ncbi:RNA polymerase sigma-70 factor (ECF subfamily) [Chitinophaga niastensis]|uniref:RNA polymerase sigma-70 factor (ECF subfamily) n=1 Tax=Chitinophaga niastensis TaxID=536980 RepID=A0A2P8HJ04_CHINA|nr:RNA polymerase sigma-70 factor [Chitinophaga niastensis]PSL46201.1 RNA polymerase sigma-70 factor (ECF subfamily) [Chitinophaga niastensis]